MFIITHLILVLILVLISALASPAHSGTRKEEQHVELLLRTAFPEATSVTSVSVPMRSSDKDSLRLLAKQDHVGDTLLVLVAANSGRLFGYAVVADARGKDQPITYCVIADENLRVVQVEVLAYREPYGGEVQNQSWLRQFLGKQPEDTLRPGRDIKNITGATISARSVTLGVKKILSLLRLVQPRLPQTTGVGQ